MHSNSKTQSNSRGEKSAIIVAIGERLICVRALMVDVIKIHQLE
jgi:hypothetical protein